jgi:hypothetical protein
MTLRIVLWVLDRWYSSKIGVVGYQCSIAMMLDEEFHEEARSGAAGSSGVMLGN